MRRSIVCSTLSAIIFSAAVGTAQEPQKPEDILNDTPDAPAPDLDEKPKTSVDDGGYGNTSLSRSERFPEPPPGGHVDRRQNIDVMADHAIVAPNAYTAEKNSWTFNTANLVFNTLSFSPTDNVQTSLNIGIPSDISDFRLGAAVKIGVVEEFTHLVSIQPFVDYSAGPDELDIMNAGLGIGVLADFYLSDRVVLSTSAHGFVNVIHGFDQINSQTCQSRQDFRDGDCVDNSPDISTFPSGGHWLAVSASMIYYMFDQWSLRFEATSGLSFGSFLGTDQINGEENSSVRRERFRNGDVKLGIPHDSDIALGAGLGWSLKSVGIQVSAYTARGVREGETEKSWLLYPVFGLSVAF